MLGKNIAPAYKFVKPQRLKTIAKMESKHFESEIEKDEYHNKKCTQKLLVEIISTSEGILCMRNQIFWRPY